MSVYENLTKIDIITIRAWNILLFSFNVYCHFFQISNIFKNYKGLGVKFVFQRY